MNRMQIWRRSQLHKFPHLVFYAFFRLVSTQLVLSMGHYCEAVLPSDAQTSEDLERVWSTLEQNIFANFYAGKILFGILQLTAL